MQNMPEQSCLSMLRHHSPRLQAVSVQELKFIEQTGPVHYKIKRDFVPNMHVPGYFYLNDRLKGLVFEELQIAAERGGIGYGSQGQPWPDQHLFACRRNDFRPRR